MKVNDLKYGEDVASRENWALNPSTGFLRLVKKRFTGKEETTQAVQATSRDGMAGTPLLSWEREEDAREEEKNIARGRGTKKKEKFKNI